MSSSRSVVTVGASRKRKEREASFDAFRKSSISSPASAHNKGLAVAGAGAGAEPNIFGLAASGSADNRLLAGYLAHEFLTKGTLLGQKWDPARAEAAPVRTPKARPGAAAKGVGGGGGSGSGGVVPAEVYADVANLLKGGGAQVPGIVNPTQLTRWLQM